MHTLSNETHGISTSDDNKSAHNADAAVYLDRTACSCSNPFLNKQEGREKKKMPSKLLKSKFPVIKRLLFLFFFFSRFNENLPSPHTALLFQSVLLKQRTGSRSSHAWACGAPQSPRWPVWSGSWRALWRGRVGSPRSTSG